MNNIKYKPFRNAFNDRLRKDKKDILSSNKVIVNADKSANMYWMDVKEYKKKVLENITSDYKKCPRNNITEVTKEAANIARRYNIEDRVDAPTEDESFITIKDHKDGFPGKIQCRLINPAKNHIGTISKKILDRINTSLRSATSSNQWMNTNSVIRWFEGINNKEHFSFFKFDIVSFYPSISKSLLMNSFSWAKSLTNINDDEINLVLHCRKTFLFFQDECWVKKENQQFDVSMGSLDSAEVCELVGLFLLSKMEELIPKQHLGLYRDDGLAVVRLPGPDVERLRKKVIKLFSTHGLKITTEVNIHTTDFLDVMLDLKTGNYRPYRKDVNPPVYINKSSNHPPNIKKELPKMISRRISDLSSSKVNFQAEATTYNEALKQAGYSESIQYMEHNPSKKRTRRRDVIWFNPPWNDEVSTNIARKFISMVDRHFPPGSELSKYFNRNTIKVSYSTMPNMARIISGHNKKLTGSTNQLEKSGCNCQKKQNCPLDGQCLTKDLVYKNTVMTTTSQKEYIGLTSTTFKQRWTAHKASFTHQNKAHSTALSSHIWELKKDNNQFNCNWTILGLAPSYSWKVRSCHLCLLEKTCISLADPGKSLNKRNEIIAKCRHRDKILLKHW